MPAIQILNEKRYHLDVGRSILSLRKQEALPYWRWEHRATLGRNGKTYMVFMDNGNILKNQFSKLYIEEITAKGLEFIEDDELVNELYRFAEEKGFTIMLPPMRKI